MSMPAASSSPTPNPPTLPTLSVSCRQMIGAALHIGEPLILILADNHSAPPVQTQPRQTASQPEHAACQSHNIPRIKIQLGLRFASPQSLKIVKQSVRL